MQYLILESAFNAIGGVIYGCIILFIAIVVLMSGLRTHDKDDSPGFLTYFFITAVIAILIVCVQQCTK